MNRRLYSLVLILLLPLVLLYLLWRSRKDPAYRRRLAERLALGLPDCRGAILVHCASMGETLAAVPLVRALQQRFPDNSLLITTTTPSGSTQVRKSFGDSVQHCYLPLDLSGVSRRFLQAVQPAMVILMETELWPNLVYHADQSGTPVMLANARMSEKSAKGYARYPKLVGPMMASLGAVAVQNADDGARLMKLGVPPARLTICGSLKFDLPIGPGEAERLDKERLSYSGERPAWCAGSTHPGEFEQSLSAHKHLLALHPDLLLILVPRHPEQFDTAVQLAEDAGLVVQRRSTGQPIVENTQVLVGDTMGELVTLYGMADAAFVGGSLIKRGGHNPLEPAALAKPVLMGPHFYNFQEIGNTLIQAGGMAMVNNPEQLADQLEHLLSLRNQAEKMGHQGQRVVDTNRGATARQLALAEGLMPGL